MKVSVVIPTYNHAQYLARAIDSALAQEMPGDELEVLVYDNASSDETPAIASRNAHNPRFRSVRDDDHVAMAANWNRAVRASRGDYVTLLSADDWLLPGHARALSAALDAHPGAGMAQCAYRMVDEQGRGGAVYPRWLRDFTAPAERMLGLYLEQTRTALNAVMFRRRVFEEVGGFDESWEISQDWDFWLRLLERSKEAVYLARPGAVYFTHRASEQNGLQVLREALRMLEVSLARLPPRLQHLRRLEPRMRRRIAGAAIAAAARVEGESARRERARIACQALPSPLVRLLARAVERPWGARLVRAGDVLNRSLRARVKAVLRRAIAVEP